MSEELFWIAGRKLASVSFDAEAECWNFAFEGGGHLRAQCPWRLLADGRIHLTSEDHGHQFGLPSPADAEAVTGARLVGRRISAIELRPITHDIVLTFESDERLEVLPMSGGYENWHATAPDGISTMIACGGGELAIFRL